MRRAALLPFALAPLALGPFPLAGPAAGQDVQPVGPQVSATISQRFEVDSNVDLQDESPGTSTLADTRLAVGLLEEGPTQRFALGFDTGLRALWQAEEDFDFTFASPSTASADYAREWASGNFSGRLRYRQARVDFVRPLDFDDPDVVIPDDPSDLEGEAIERRYDGTFALALATDRPSSYAFALTANRIDYSEDAANRSPRSTVEGNATWQLQLTPTFSGTLSGRGFFYEADNPAETAIRESEIDVGVVYAPTTVLQVTAGVGYFDRERRETVAGDRQTDDDAGIAFRTGVNYAFEDFTVNASLRAATAPDTRISGNLALSYPLARGQLNARLFQSFAGGVGGDEVRVTGGSIGLLQELDAVSRVNVDLAASRRVSLDADEPDVDRVDFTTSLGYDITERVSADVGYRYRIRNEGDIDADSHAVFVQVGRTFTTGF